MEPEETTSGAVQVGMLKFWTRTPALSLIVSVKAIGVPQAKLGEVETANVPGTSAELEIAGEFKPLVETPDSRRLLDHYADCASDVGLKVEGEFTGGCADSGFTAAVGTPTICAVGPVGGKAHTPDEYLEVDSIVPRAQTLALAVARLT
jgi:glutamate carboxypeptidase